MFQIGKWWSPLLVGGQATCFKLANGGLPEKLVEKQHVSNWQMVVSLISWWKSNMFQIGKWRSPLLVGGKATCFKLANGGLPY